MSSLPEDFLFTSQKYIQTASTESDFRCCISRAYYAGYHLSLNFHNLLSRPGVSSQTGGMHENLIHQLSYPSIDKSDADYIKSRVLGQYLKKMKYRRRQSDYQLSDQVDLSLANSQISEANLILTTI